MTNLADTAIHPHPIHERRLSGRSRMGSCMGVRVAATGSYVPDLIVTNEDLVALGCDSDWIFQRTGILERRRAAAGQASSDLAYEAAIRCLSNAGVAASDVDLVIVATMTPDFLTPSTACLLQRRLNCTAPAMDVNAACAGFMYAFVTAGNFVRSGMAKRALVVGSEVMSATINPSDIKTYPLFGDGAGAALLVADSESTEQASENRSSDSRHGAGLLAYTLGSEGSGAEMLCIPGGGSRQPLSHAGIEAGQQYLTMDGRGVFKWAVRVVNDSCRDCMIHAGYPFSEVDLVLLHQANIRIIDSAVKDFGVPRDRVFVNLDRFGNTSAASIPLALDQANAQGRIRRNDRILMCGFGAGLAWGSALLRW
ncbi:MAG: beta-ketoacyl-ACP synthase III [Pirellulaceae bacterium]|nr:beta-ketoacyl-ACP synthase III [Pirellulaceae bacterium]